MSEKLQHQLKVYDLIVCGAGIYGAWSAYDASLRGLKVLIVDKGDIANATSSASSKLIHGGLRYLEHFNFSLVKKSAWERQLLLKLAPHRVSPLRFGVPLYKKSRVKKWQLKVGLFLYDYFAKFKLTQDKHSTFNASGFSEKFPQLNKDSLTSGFSYQDAQTDDSRYTLEIIDGAIKNGAELMTYTELLKYDEDYGHISGVTLKKQDGQLLSLKTRSALHTGGQFTDQQLSTDLCRLSKGIHITVPDMGLKEALLLLAPEDGRVFFIIPWYGITLIGTTDTDYHGSLNQVTAYEEDINYLLNQANPFLKNSLRRQDVIQSFAGLRVLKKSSQSHPSAASRDWSLEKMDNGLFVSIGGKFTSARADAAKIIDAICNKLKIHEQTQTGNIYFPWSCEEFEGFKNQVLTKFSHTLIDRPTLSLLIQRQGTRSLEVLELVKKDNTLANRLHPKLPFTRAEWKFVIENEYITTYDDLFQRRFPINLLYKLTEKEKASLKKEANEIYKTKFNQELQD